jgi:pimeloyl-ACP methyl ester carboxylesterase
MARRVLVGVVAVILGAAGTEWAQPTPPPQAAPKAAASSGAQRWKGVVELPQGVKLDIGVMLMPARDGGAASGTIDIPMQGVKGAALSEVKISGEEIGFTIAGPGADASAVFTLKPSPDGKAAAGEIRQAGATMPVKLERIPEGASTDIGPPRPQEPKPPFPYAQRELTYTNAKDGTTLAGTLTIPEGAGPFPAVVMITGSGAQDRDETLLGHKPFLVIADHLTRHGVAVLRADDRGVGGSTGSVAEATAEDEVGDALAGVALLKSVPDIDGAHIGLIGHSEGAIVAPMASAQSADVAFIVLLAGPGLKGRDLLTMQSEAIMRAAGQEEGAITKATTLHRGLMDALERGADRAEIESAIRELAAAQREGMRAPPLSDQQMNAIVKQQVMSLQTRWFKSFLFLDPREALRGVKAPVLALNGSLDTQVPAKANLGEIEKALRNGGNKDVTARELPGLNHLFQHARTGSPEEYAQIEQTFAPEALAVITDWVVAHTRPGR